MNPRTEIERAFGGKLKDRVWEELVHDGHVTELEDGTATADQVANWVRRQSEIYGNGQVRRRSEPPETLPENAPAAGLGARAIAVSKLLALIVGNDPTVVTFRNDVLGGRPIAPSAVDQWEIDALRAEKANPQPTEELARRLWMGQLAGRRQRLRELGDQLERKFGWSVQAACRFVLCGSAPFMAPIRVKELSERDPWVASRVVISIDPTVSPVELAEAWREIRGKVRAPKPITEKHLDLAVWAAEQGKSTWEAESDDPGPSWTTLMSRWNRAKPNMTYSVVTNFSRDVRAAQDRLLNPGKRGG